MGYLDFFFFNIWEVSNFKKEPNRNSRVKNSTNAVEFTENRVNQMEERVSELRQESKNTLSRRGERTKDFESKKFKKKNLQELSDSNMRANIRITDTPEREEKERGQSK